MSNERSPKDKRISADEDTKHTGTKSRHLTAIDDEQRKTIKRSSRDKERERDEYRHQHYKDREHHHDYHRYDRNRRTERDRTSNWRDREIDRSDHKRRISFTSLPDEADTEQSSYVNRPSWENSKVRKHAEMLKERKLLWKGKGSSDSAEKEHQQLNDDKNTEMPKVSDDGHTNGGAEAKEKRLENKWHSMIAATARDTQQLDKFQRLMGMKKKGVGSNDQEACGSTEPLVTSNAQIEDGSAKEKDNVFERERRRQMELAQGLSQQFELARQSHHTARGRGLGSF